MFNPINAKAALLQALLWGGKGYGLSLLERVEELTDGGVRLGQGSLYPALRALEREGFVTSWESDPLPERGGRPRRYYELTGEGVQEARRLQTAVQGLYGHQVGAI